MFAVKPVRFFTFLICPRFLDAVVEFIEFSFF